VNRTQWIALIVVAALAACMIYLAVRGRQPPLLPADEDHARFLSAEDCLICHDLNSDSPQGRNHPLGNDCSRCHGRP
jgi:hypothetical protein